MIVSFLLPLQAVVIYHVYINSFSIYSNTLSSTLSTEKPLTSQEDRRTKHREEHQKKVRNDAFPVVLREFNRGLRDGILNHARRAAPPLFNDNASTRLSVFNRLRTATEAANRRPGLLPNGVGPVFGPRFAAPTLPNGHALPNGEVDGDSSSTEDDILA